MASLRQIRSRLRSISSTKQIMRAMQLVSASKLKRAQGRLLQARAVLGFLDGLLQRVLAASPSLHHPLCAARAEGPSLLVLFTSDAGLCGAYNTNLIQLAESHLRRDTAKRTQVVYVGKKGHRYFTRRGHAAAAAYLDLAGRPDLAKAEAIGRALMARFLDGRVASVELLYSQFASSTVYRPTLLRWLPIRQRRSGLSEVIKYAAIADPTLFRFLEDHLEPCLAGELRVNRVMVERCARIKARIVGQDERETKGIRTQLNFGHTLGHALEAATGYRRFTHGEAIAIGMACASRIGVALGCTPSSAHARLVRLFARAGLPTRTSGLRLAAVRQALVHDKKFTHGRMRWVLLRRIGQVIVSDRVPPALMWRVIREHIA